MIPRDPGGRGYQRSFQNQSIKWNIESYSTQAGKRYLQPKSTGKINVMSPEVSDLLKRALALPVDERAALANTLLDSLEQAQQSVQAAWDEEVARRMRDLKAGKAVTVPWEELHQELLAMQSSRLGTEY
jgi:putative addiction module component (TIGR02574 family)